MAEIKGKSITELYTDMLDNNPELLYFCLADQVVLNWFGKTLRGKDAVITLLVKELENMKHVLTQVDGPSGLVEFQHEFELASETLCVDQVALSLESLDCGERERPRLLNMEGAGDSMDLCTDFDPLLKEERGRGDCLGENGLSDLVFFEARGTLQFSITQQSPNTSKNLKLLANTRKWERSCKLQVGYNISPGKSDFKIFKIMYDHNSSRLRRNLALEFESLVE